MRISPWNYFYNGFARRYRCIFAINLSMNLTVQKEGTEVNFILMLDWVLNTALIMIPNLHLKTFLFSQDLNKTFV